MDVKSILLNQRDGICLEGALLKACIDMYRATGDIQYRDGVLEYLNNCISSDGVLMETISKHGLNIIVPFGKAMFFAWDETGEERYKNAAQQIMERLSSLEQSLNPDVAASQGLKLPYQSFIIEYDNRFGNKQRYKEAAHCFQTVRNNFFNSEKQLYHVVLKKEFERKHYNLVNHCWVLLSLVDAIDEMDMQLYEHYRAIADLFLEAVRGLLPYRKKGIGLLTDSVINSDDPVSIDDNLIAAYALFKGIRLGLLDDEKYMPIAIEMVSAIKKTCASDLLDAGFPGSLCYRMMAEAEMRRAAQ